MPSITAVVGGQFGSEGKGNIVHHIANGYHVHVRTGGPNAGHTFYYRGEKQVMQSLPCGWTNPNATLVIGPGAVVDPALLVKEIEAARRYFPDITTRIKVSPKGTVITEREHSMEGGVNGQLHSRIGSTGEGVGIARIFRLERNDGHYQLLGDVAHLYGGDGWSLADLLEKDMPRWLNGVYDLGANILLEGTQGSGLSLIHGPWPYVTTNDTNAAQLLADAGLSPTLNVKVLLVFRTYPIRVAGNSGPMHGEITWEELSRRVGRSIEEKTTVTKKVRRVAEFDYEQARLSLALNRPTEIAINFLDYLFPGDEGVSSWSELSMPAKKYISTFCERYTRAPVKYVGTGGEGCVVVNVPNLGNVVEPKQEPEIVDTTWNFLE